MIFSFRSDQLCSKQIIHDLFKRSELTTTAESFKSWNTCMDNKTCKIVAIVGIVVASIVLFGFIGFLIRCLCCGVRGLGEIFCCCCDCFRCCSDNSQRHNHQSREPQKSVYDNPFMYPQEQANPHYQPNMTYTPVAQPQFHYAPGVTSNEVNHGHQSGYGNSHNQGYGYGQSGGQTYKGQFV